MLSWWMYHILWRNWVQFHPFNQHTNQTVIHYAINFILRFNRKSLINQSITHYHNQILQVIHIQSPRYEHDRQCLLKKLFHIIFEAQRIWCRLKALDNLSVFVTQEFSEVPFDGSTQQPTTCALCEIYEQRIRHSFRTAAIDFAKNWESCAFSFSKILNIWIWSWFLRSKVVARKSKNLQSTWTVFGIQRLQFSVVGVR